MKINFILSLESIVYFEIFIRQKEFNEGRLHCILSQKHRGTYCAQAVKLHNVNTTTELHFYIEEFILNPMFAQIIN